MSDTVCVCGNVDICNEFEILLWRASNILHVILNFSLDEHKHHHNQGHFILQSISTCTISRIHGQSAFKQCGSYQACIIPIAYSISYAYCHKTTQLYITQNNAKTTITKFHYNCNHVYNDIEVAGASDFNIFSTFAAFARYTQMTQSFI